MRNKQIEKNQRTYDLLGSIICAFPTGLLLAFFANPAFLPNDKFSINVSIIAFCVSFVSYLFSCWIIWKLHSLHKIGAEINWLLILLLCNVSLCHGFISFYDMKLPAFLKISYFELYFEFLSLFFILSFPPMFFIWLVGLCHRFIKFYSQNAITLNPTILPK